MHLVENQIFNYYNNMFETSQFENKLKKEQQLKARMLKHKSKLAFDKNRKKRKQK